MLQSAERPHTEERPCIRPLGGNHTRGAHPWAIALVCLLAGSALTGAMPAQAETIADQTRAAAEDLLRGAPARSVETLTAALEAGDIPNERRALILNDRGLARWQAGDPAGAIADYNEAVGLYPEMAALYNNRGTVLLALGMAKEARRDFDRAVLLAPGYGQAYSNRANAQVQFGQLDSAIADYSRAASLIPGSAATYNGRGQVHQLRGRMFMARRDYAQAISVDPKHAPSYLARAEVNLEADQFSEAIDDLTAALSFAPNDIRIYLVRGRAHADASNYNSALKDFSQAIELAPDKAEGYVRRGEAYAHVRQTEQALADINRALEIDHRNADAYAARAFAYLKAGTPELGLPDTERALKLNSDHAGALRTRAGLREELGQLDAAIADYQRVIELRPRDQAAWDALERLSGAEPPGNRVLDAVALGPWDVTVDPRGRYFAVNAEIKRLRVPLELFGTEPPRLLDWEEKDRPYRGIGVLRFAAGNADYGKGDGDIELAAVIDTYERRVVAIEPWRFGNQNAVWTWEGGEVTVIGPDGITERHKLRRVQVARTPTTRNTGAASNSRGEPDWFSFNQNGPFSSNRGTAQRSQTNRRRKKPKTLFDLLFN